MGIPSNPNESPEARENRLARYRARHETHREEDLERAKRWREENPEKFKVSQKDWNARNSKEWNRLRRQGLKGPYSPEDGPDWQERNREHYLAVKRENTNRRRREVALEALCHYGGDPPKCYCCGETEVLLLSLDHINGGGNKHRKETKMTRLYEWAKQNGWPTMFRVACHSCNLGAHLNGGVCPHQARG